jgi:hypothetical protein
VCGHEFSVIFSSIRFKVLPLCVGSRKSIWRVLNSKFLSISQKKNDGPSKLMFINLLEVLGKGNCTCTAVHIKYHTDYQLYWLVAFFLEWNISIGSCCSRKSLTLSLEHVFLFFFILLVPSSLKGHEIKAVCHSFCKYIHTKLLIF